MNEIINVKMLDPRLQKMLTAYGLTPERDPEASRRTRARFMAEVDKMFADQGAPQPSVGWIVIASWITALDQVKNRFAPLLEKRVFVFLLIAFLVFGISLFGGVGLTAYASASSLPGDVIYPLKTSLESARAGLTIDSAAKARLYVDFAGLRLSEIQFLIDNDRYDHIGQATHEFERDIQRSLNAIKSLSQTDPAYAAALNMEISTILGKYSDVLMNLLADVPMEVQPDIQEAIDAIRSATGVEEDNSGSNPNPMPTMTAPPVPSTLTPVPDPSAVPGKNPSRGSDDDGGKGGNGGDDDGPGDVSGDDDGGDDSDDGGDDD